jgi:hypothetical protein
MHKDNIGYWLLGICVAFSLSIPVIGLGYCIYRLVEHFLK